MIGRVAIIMLLVSSTSAAALTGEWCRTSDAGMGEAMFIDSYGIGFNEHTICNVENLPVAMNADDRWTSAIACRNVHVVDIEGDGVSEHVIERPVDGFTQITLTGAADGTLILSTDLHDDEMHFLPCEG